ncbi:MAG TPA: hypothetical protein VFF59_07320, partial [Anaerolineae bacterium]|nr:hypothetical protein [Anaerolineae bacterium]
INRHNGIEWFNKEALELLLWDLFATAVIDLTAKAGPETDEVANAIVAAYDVIVALQAAEAASGYQVDKLIEAARSVSAPKATPKATRKVAKRNGEEAVS